MKNLKTVGLFILGIIWLFCILVTLAGFGVFTIHIGDMMSGQDSLLEMINKPCNLTPPSYCMIETSYKIYLQNKIAFFTSVVIGVLGLAYIKRKPLFKFLGIKNKN